MRLTALSVRGCAMASFWMAMTLGSEASALVVCDCAPRECGFSFPSVEDCRAYPANHRVLLHVTCSNEIPEEAFPKLRASSGRELRGDWRPVEGLEAFAFEGNGRARAYEFVGEPLPVGEEVRAVTRAPAHCWAAFNEDSCGTARCEAPDPDSADCCGLYSRAGLSFAATTSGGGAGGAGTGEGGNAGSAGVPPSNPSEEELVRFFVDAEDTEPPPTPTPRLSCLALPSSGVVQIIFDEPLTDVAYLVGEFTGSAAPSLRRVLESGPCGGVGATSLSVTRTNVGHGDVELRIRVHDWSGNSTLGPPLHLRVPEDCDAESFDDLLAGRPCPESTAPEVPGCVPRALSPTPMVEGLCEDDDAGLSLRPAPDPGTGGAPGGGASSAVDDTSCACDLSRAPPRAPLAWLAIPLLTWARRRSNRRRGTPLLEK